MINAIYGKKIGMTQIFNEDDRVVPVTVIQAEPNTICQVKTKDSDGYEAVQLGFGAIKEKKVNKPMAGHFAKQGTAPTRYLREVRVENAGEYKVGDQQTVAAFAETKKVDVTGTSKASAAARAATARTSIALPVRWASAPRRPACSRGSSSRATWASTP